MRTTRAAAFDGSRFWHTSMLQWGTAGARDAGVAAASVPFELCCLVWALATAASAFVCGHMAAGGASKVPKLRHVLWLVHLALGSCDSEVLLINLILVSGTLPCR